MSAHLKFPGAVTSNGGHVHEVERTGKFYNFEQVKEAFNLTAGV